jgi:hypothetical protein
MSLQQQHQSMNGLEKPPFAKIRPEMILAGIARTSTDSSSGSGLDSAGSTIEQSDDIRDAVAKVLDGCDWTMITLPTRQQNGQKRAPHVKRPMVSYTAGQRQFLIQSA